MGVKTEIVHCYRTFLPESQGGLEQIILEVAQNTAHSSVVTLAASKADYSVGRRAVPVSASKRWFSVASCCVGFGIVANLWRHSASVFHFHSPWPFGDLAYLLGGRSRPLVVTYHSDVVRQKLLNVLYYPLMSCFLARADRIVATSQNYVASSPVLAKYRGKVEVIPLGISEEEYPEPSGDLLAATERYYGRDFMLFVGVLRYYKGLEYLIRAAVEQPYRVVIAGKGPELGRLKALANDLEASNVVFAGFVSDEEKVALMNLCRAVVLPSHLRSEAFGVTLIEGLMYGKPLISCEIGTGTSYVNRDGETGHVIPPANPTALREAMGDFWRNPLKAKRVGWKGRQRYEKLFTGEQMAVAYQKLYRDVLNSREDMQTWRK
ncbi:glycosyltransferase [Microbulbifer litoralis]|uniref:glycosyltransferase n=1 Tax=Microbulbifer litoralis TaxID=2933965 RepID=UPI00202932E1|nr:glycosyltransferase [Microbulbifer sp. GX H0434]